MKIYSILDPRNNTTGFVGASKNPQALFWLAISQAKDGRPGRKSMWVRALLLDDVKPHLHILETVPHEEVPARLAFWRTSLGADRPTTRTYPPKSPSEARKHPGRARSLRKPYPSRRRETRDTERSRILLKLYRQRPPQGIGSNQEIKPNPRPVNEKEPI